ncbi:pitrilysin family protein [Paracoccus sp. SCSIO 75233]|uniref:M16 family metallopeptidase n=1 Tax=Paracoccus sp. SCSIO 75233 TaxID=3017782 RepID=UPI0022EFE540|nr:pitrilysin family protein [Paracoccus sp. SCSIO 75233]WBU53647.1 pitrilysin family protein [Paracoccus sp. SCSIO 75233]
MSDTNITTLPNGLRIVTRRMPSLHSATLGVWVNAGGRDERAEQNGIAHFLEHMAFKGTATRTALQIAEEIEDVGGYINAYTSRDTTAYYARVLAPDTSLALDVISDILLNPSFDEREIEVERGVILQEIGQALDTPDDIVFDWLQEAAYPDQAIGRTILGPAERVSQFGRPDLARFVTEHYGPGQMILAAAGAVDHDTIVRQAEASLGKLPAREALGRDGASWQGSEIRRVKNLEQAHFTLAFEGPGYLSPQFHAAQIWTVAMGGGMSSRLFQKIREERGLCYTIFAQSGFHDDTGMMTVYAGTAGEDLPELAQLTVDELKRSVDSLSDAEIARAKAQLKAGMLMGLESSSGQAERIARSLSIWGRVPEPAESAARIDAVTRQDIAEYAAALIARRPAMALYGPVEGAPTLDRLSERLAA